jgi:hypothetical protein
MLRVCSEQSNSITSDNGKKAQKIYHQALAQGGWWSQTQPKLGFAGVVICLSRGLVLLLLCSGSGTLIPETPGQSEQTSSSHQRTSILKALLYIS